MTYTAQNINDNHWVVTDNEGLQHTVFCKESENTKEYAISLIRDFVPTEESE